MPKPEKGKKLDPKTVDQHMMLYSESAANTMLEEAFGKWDIIHGMHISIPYLDRADHIIIGGRTATELLVEKFNDQFDQMTTHTGENYNPNQRVDAYNIFYQDNAKKLLNQLVAEAVSNGEKVEMFVPDAETGQIQENPMRLTASGVVPGGPLARPAQMTLWQRFWSKLGFYKREKAAVVNYNKEKAARERVQFCNKAARANLTTNSTLKSNFDAELAAHHPEILEDMQKNFPHAQGDVSMLGQANGFKTERTSFHAIAMGLLATKRNANRSLMYTNEQLYNMTDPKMQQARADAMKEVYERYKPGALLVQEKKKQEEAQEQGKTYKINPELEKLEKKTAENLDWLVDLQRDAADVLRQRINEQAQKLDFSKPGLTEQKNYREFALLSDTAFDYAQDMIATKNRMNEKYGENAYMDAAGKVGDWSQFSSKLGQSMLSQKYLYNGIPGEYPASVMRELSKVFQAQTCFQQVSKQLQAESKANFADLANNDLMNAGTIAMQGALYDGNENAVADYVNNGTPIPNKLTEQSVLLAREQILNPEQFNKQIQNGVLESRMKLQSINETSPSFELRDAKTAERELQQQRMNGAALSI